MATTQQLRTGVFKPWRVFFESFFFYVIGEGQNMTNRFVFKCTCNCTEMISDCPKTHSPTVGVLSKGPMRTLIRQTLGCFEIFTLTNNYLIKCFQIEVRWHWQEIQCSRIYHLCSLNAVLYWEMGNGMGIWKARSLRGAHSITIFISWSFIRATHWTMPVVLYQENSLAANFLINTGGFGEL